jgi:lipoprotein-anchoring transpeptidase ErfK/SrfK
MSYTRGEVSGIAAIVMAIGAVGTTMNLADPSPHLAGPHRASQAASADAAPVSPALASAPALTPAAAPSSAPAPAPSSAPAPSPTPEPLVIRRVLPIDGPIRYGEWHWDEAGVPAGPLVITVDLEARVMSVFRGGYEIGVTAVLLGTQEKPTPLGVFPITQKDKHHMSNLYDAPMPYMQRLTNDGVTIHATNVRNGYASHGCIGVPLDFARKLFAATRLGTPVYITRGKQVGVGDPVATS